MSRPLKLMLAAASLAAAGAVADGSAAPAAERVTIQRKGWVLAAVLYRPAGTGPFPAVVGLHGCDGVITAGGKVGANYANWGERLAAAGFLLLLPDSFGSRGLGSQCRASDRRVRAFVERVADAQAARQWLQRQSFVINDRVSLLGWSNGAIATLWAVRPQAGPQDGLPDFRTAVAFYPGCGTVAKAGWSARVPTLVLLGQADDWTPAGPCAQMVAAAQGRDAIAEVVMYPGAYHAFDRADFPLRELTGLSYSGNRTGKAHVGTNEAARADALRRVPEWLAR
jgi:dienelactone hydrolase